MSSDRAGRDAISAARGQPEEKVPGGRPHATAIGDEAVEGAPNHGVRI